MATGFDAALREWAEAYLEDLRDCLRQDPAVYQEYGARAFDMIGATVDDLLRRVRNSEMYPNHEYNRQGDLAAGLIVLSMEYPQDYAQLMVNVVGGGSVRTFNGACRLASVLNLLSDDHDYVLVQDGQGVQRLYHESNQPAGIGFVPLTCARDLAEVVLQLLSERGFAATPLEPSRG